MTTVPISDRSSDTHFKKDQFAKFASLVTKNLGIKMPEAKSTMLASRLNKRLRALDLPDFDAYQDYLSKSDRSETEMKHLFDAVTTNKTDFFRESGHFDFLLKTGLPQLDPGQGKAWKFKLWCAGCSSGEEAYTQAITLSEFGRNREPFDFSILATDISTQVLSQAKTAIYNESRIQPISYDLRKRYLLRSADPDRPVVRITQELRKRINFQRLNFMDTDYRIREMFDVVFFRNVMIYFDRPTQEAVVNKLCKNLKRGGFLFTAHSETLHGLDVPLKAIGNSIYQRL